MTTLHRTTISKIRVGRLRKQFNDIAKSWDDDDDDESSEFGFLVEGGELG
jgi:hypothetical protein